MKKSQLKTAIGLHENLLERMQDQYPEYAGVLEEEIQVSLQQVMTSLNPDEAILEYYLSDGVVHCLKITRVEATYYSVEHDQALDSLVGEFFTSIQEFYEGYAPRDIARYADAAYTLHTMLLAPLGNLPESLIIVPDDVLHYVVFETLLDHQVTPGTPLRKFPFLVKRHNIRYASTASLSLQGDLDRRVGTRRQVISVAPVQQGNTDSPLLNSADEARYVHDCLGGDMLLFERATKSGVIDRLQSGNRYGGVHFATHGRTQSTADDAFIELFGSKDQDSSRLYAFELFSLTFPVDYVFLSACETGYGKILAGEGIMSLARAFAYSGVNTTVTSLWRINDALTLPLVKEFYREFKRSRPASEAMTNAKRTFLQEISAKEDYKAHPIFWSGLIVIGQDIVLEPSPGFGLYLWMGAGVVLALMVGLYLVGKARQKKI